jgi:hypothetical protein
MLYKIEVRQLSRCLRMVTPLLVAAILMFGGCKKEDDAAKGSLVVPFQLGSGKSCDEVGITRVKATLDEDAHSKDVPCSRQEIRFENIESGVYSLKLYGINAEGIAVMDSFNVDDVKVEEDNTVTVDPVVLSDAPGVMRLRWALGYGNCKIWNMDRFDLKVWSEDGNKLLLETKLKCDLNQVDRDQYRTVPDPSRDLDGSNLGALQVQPVDANGTSIGSKKPVKFTFKSPGPGGLIKLSVDCGGDGCDGSGEADQ